MFRVYIGFRDCFKLTKSSVHLSAATASPSNIMRHLRLLPEALEGGRTARACQPGTAGIFPVPIRHA